jgi:hypothetical protein
MFDKALVNLMKDIRSDGIVNIAVQQPDEERAGKEV